MSYYKIIKNGEIIDVNNLYFRYQSKRMNLINCEQESAQLIQSSDEKSFYRTGWLKPLPKGIEHEWVEAILISKEEYDKLKEELKLYSVVVPAEEEIISENKEESVTILDEKPQEKIVNIRELYEEIRQLKEELKSLKK